MTISKIKNGQSAEPQGPPWLTVDSEQLIQELRWALSQRDMEMAAMRAYIGHLSQALAQVTGEQDGRNTVPEGTELHERQPQDN